MKHLTIFLLFFLLSPIVSAQTTEFVANYDSAVHISHEKELPLIIYFSGSDWCKPCIKLKAEILLSPEFAVYSKGFVIYIADFPYRSKQTKDLKKVNEGLAEKYNPKGIFPNLVVVNEAEKIVYQIGYKDNKPAEFIAEMRRALNP